jgi:hypothetical protein
MDSEANFAENAIKYPLVFLLCLGEKPSIERELRV